MAISTTTADVCQGLVRIRQQRPCDQKQQLRQQLELSRQRHSLTATLLDARGGDASRLNEDEWYFCVLRAQTQAIQWFTINDNNGIDDDDDDDDGNGGPSRSRKDSVLLAATAVSHFEVLEDCADSEKKAMQEPEVERENDRGSLTEFDGLKLDVECTFYMEDHANGVRAMLQHMVTDIYWREY